MKTKSGSDEISQGDKLEYQLTLRLRDSTLWGSGNRFICGDPVANVIDPMVVFVRPASVDLVPSQA